MNPGDRAPDWREQAFGALQRVLPTRLLSQLVFWLTRIDTPWFKDRFIRVFMRAFRISLEEAEHPRPEDYPTFNAFFTRALKPGARPLVEEAGAWACPVDGTVSQLGAIDGSLLFQAKGHHYTAAELLGDAGWARPFEGGQFCTIYLAPYNYHRIHMPVDGVLTGWRLIPGRLFSVNGATARTLPRLFARNERVVTRFDTPHGPLALVLVGALNVGSMETVWAGQITPPHRRGPQRHWIPDARVELARGAEMGRFNMGSTVILLAPPGRVAWEPGLAPGQVVRMGEMLGQSPV